MFCAWVSEDKGKGLGDFETIVVLVIEAVEREGMAESGFE